MNHESIGQVSSNPRIAGFPSSYIQSPGLLRNLGDHLSQYHFPFGVVIEPELNELFPKATSRAINQFIDENVLLPFNGECTIDAIDTLFKRGLDANICGVLAIGGGKSLDTGKAVSARLNVPVVVAPSIASNDAPTSRLSVIYNADHSVSGVELMPQNPNSVLVDMEVIANAPQRFLAAGIGDAIGKFFESTQVAAAGGINFFKGRPTSVASALATASYHTLQENSVKAVDDCSRCQITEELERVVECNILISGLCFENGGLSITHAMIRGLSAQPECQSMLHGELAAFALLIQVSLSCGLQQELRNLIQLFKKIGLPTNFQDLGFNNPVSLDQAIEIANITLEAPYSVNFERTLDAREIAQVLITYNH